MRVMSRRGIVLKGRRGIVLKGRRGIVLTCENKVNSFSNQLEFSWVCKLEWSLTTSSAGSATLVDTS